MRLAEYLFGDPGGPPQPDYGDNSHMAADRGEDGLFGRAEVPYSYGMGDPIAPLDGQPIPHLAHGYRQETAMRYRHMLGFHESLDEASSAKLKATVVKLVATIDTAKRSGNVKREQAAHEKLVAFTQEHGINFENALSGARKHLNKKNPIGRSMSGFESLDEVLKMPRLRKIALGFYESADGRFSLNKRSEGPGWYWRDETEDAGGDAFRTKKDAEEGLRHWIEHPEEYGRRESLDEVLKKGENVQSAGDNRAISKLEGGKYPAKAEDGKGFCFQWADGRGICAFKWRNDALRWAKEQPRDITKFWYGEPVHSNGKFRIRVRDRYHKEEDLDETITFRKVHATGITVSTAGRETRHPAVWGFFQDGKMLGTILGKNYGYGGGTEWTVTRNNRDIHMPFNTIAAAKKWIQSQTFDESLDETWASDIKKLKLAKDDEAIPTMWRLEARLRESGHLRKGLSLTFFCPVYFAGQLIVDALLNKEDEHGEKLLFSLPSIVDSERIQIGLAQMLSLGIKDPERHLKRVQKGKDKGKLALRCYSSLPGIEGVGSAINYPHIAQEAVQLGAFMLVPDEWVNQGDPYNQSYRFPGEEGYSPYWRVPPFNEFRKMRPKLAADFKRKGLARNESVTRFSDLLTERSGVIS